LGNTYKYTTATPFRNQKFFPLPIYSLKKKLGFFGVFLWGVCSPFASG
jgi:hypothetical protein